MYILYVHIAHSEASRWMYILHTVKPVYYDYITQEKSCHWHVIWPLSRSMPITSSLYCCLLINQVMYCTYTLVVVFSYCLAVPFFPLGISNIHEIHSNVLEGSYEHACMCCEQGMQCTLLFFKCMPASCRRECDGVLYKCKVMSKVVKSVHFFTDE